MFEAAELGRAMSKKDYHRQVPVLRRELLAVQQELRRADFPVIVLFAGVDAAGKGETVSCGPSSGTAGAIGTPRTVPYRVMNLRARRARSLTLAGGDDTFAALLPSVNRAVLLTVSTEGPASGLNYRFCPQCGGSLALKLVKAGDPERLVCTECGFVFFLDPKVAAGTIFTIGGKIILGRRAIEPAYGKWVFPGGFVDRGETIEAAALRETREEMNVEVELAGLINVYSYHNTPVVVLVYAAEVVGGELLAADECLEVRGYEPAKIPWEELAFASTRDALRDYIRRYMCPRRGP